MGNKPNAAQVTHALAQLGGGAKKDGGGGMMEGIKNVYNTGFSQGVQHTIDNNRSPKEIETSTTLQIGDG